MTSLTNGAFTAINAVYKKNASRATMKPGKIRVVRDGTDLSETLTVHYQISGSAVAGQDYSMPQGWVTIPAGSSFAVVKIHPLPDSTPDVEPASSRMVTVTLESVDQAPLMAMGTAQASLMIN